MWTKNRLRKSHDLINTSRVRKKGAEISRLDVSTKCNSLDRRFSSEFPRRTSSLLTSLNEKRNVVSNSEINQCGSKKSVEEPIFKIAVWYNKHLYGCSSFSCGMQKWCNSPRKLNDKRKATWLTACCASFLWHDDMHFACRSKILNKHSLQITVDSSFQNIAVSQIRTIVRRPASYY